MIIKWAVSNWLGKPEKKEYSRETEHFYMHARGRGRDAKINRYECYFDSEGEALDYITKKKEARARLKEIGQIKLHAIELLEALEGMASLFPAGVEDEGSGIGFNENLKSKYRAAISAIAKAKGLTQ